MDPWIYPEYFGVRLDKVKCWTSDYFGTIWCYSIMFASDLDFKGVLSVEQLSWRLHSLADNYASYLVYAGYIYIYIHTVHTHYDYIYIHMIVLYIIVYLYTYK